VGQDWHTYPLIHIQMDTNLDIYIERDMDKGYKLEEGRIKINGLKNQFWEGGY